MKFSTKYSDLIDCVSAVIPALGKASVNPVLDHVLIEADDQNNTLTMTATNLDVQIAKTMPCDVNQAGKTTISGSKLFSIVKASNSTEMKFELKVDQLILKTGRSRFRLSTLHPDSYPTIGGFEPLTTFSIQSMILSHNLSKAMVSCAQNDVRMYLNGLCFNLDKGSLSLASSDGHRLSECKVNVEHENGENNFIAIVPRLCITTICKTISQVNENITVSFNENHMSLQAESLVVVCKQIAGQYPDYRRLIPTAINSTCLVNHDFLISALSASTIPISGAKFPVLSIKSGNGSLIIQSTSDSGEDSLIELDCETSGAFEVSTNAHFMIEAIKAAGGESSTISWSSEMSPILVQGLNDDSIFLVMPVRL